MINFDQKSDIELLRHFSEDGAAGAFDVLVQRYVGMVCGVAKRVTGRRELAEEAAQNVFAQLAHKARSLVGRGGRLAGWLHRAAVFEAKHLLRGERRHERRVREAGERQELSGELASADEQLRAEIDSALNSLAAGDREIIVWHYYAGLSYREIAERSGKSEAAAQKQGRRALEKLGSRLRGAGVTASTAALVSFFGSGLSEAVAVEVATGWGAAALAGKGSQVALPLAGVGKAVVGAGAAAVLLATIIYQGQSLAEQRRQIDSLKPAEARGGATGLSALKRPDFHTDPSFREAEDIDLERLANDLYAGAQQFDRNRALRAMATVEGIKRLHREAICELFERGDEMKLSPGRRALLLAKIAPIVAIHDPAWLVEYCFPGSVEGRRAIWVDHRDIVYGVLEGVGKEWVGRDRRGALVWLAKAVAEERFGNLNGSNESESLAGFAKAIAVANWPGERVLVEEMVRGLPRACLESVVRGMPKQIEGDASLLAFVESPMVEDARDYEVGIFYEIGSHFAERDWGEVMAIADQISDPFAKREVLIGAVREEWRPDGEEGDQKIDLFLKWAREQGVPDSEAGYMVGGMLGGIGIEHVKGLERARRVSVELGYGDLAMGSYLAHCIGPGHPMELLKQAVEELDDPEARAVVGYRAVVYINSVHNRAEVLRGVGFSEFEIELVDRRFGE